MLLLFVCCNAFVDTWKRQGVCNLGVQRKYKCLKKWCSRICPDPLRPPRTEVGPSEEAHHPAATRRAALRREDPHRICERTHAGGHRQGKGRPRLYRVGQRARRGEEHAHVPLLGSGEVRTHKAGEGGRAQQGRVVQAHPPRKERAEDGQLGRNSHGQAAEVLAEDAGGSQEQGRTPHTMNE